MPIFYSNKYKDDADRWIFTQDKIQKEAGLRIIKWVSKKWQPHALYYHFRKGGHVEAVRSHLNNTYFFKTDIHHFFASITRSKLIRCFVKIGFKFPDARDHIMQSTVYTPSGDAKYSLPFGFVQSPFLATLVLQKSPLGKTLAKLQGHNGLNISVYMDDIVISGKSAEILLLAKTSLFNAAKQSGFNFNPAKTTEAVERIEVFNIELCHNSMKITDSKMEEFTSRVSKLGECKESIGIIQYVWTVNKSQSEFLQKQLEIIPIS